MRWGIALQLVMLRGEWGLQRPDTQTLQGGGGAGLSPDGAVTPFHPPKSVYKWPRTRPTVMTRVYHMERSCLLLLGLTPAPPREAVQNQILMTVQFWFTSKRKKKNQQWQNDEAVWLSRSANKTSISLSQGCARRERFSSRSRLWEWVPAAKCW